MSLEDILVKHRMKYGRDEFHYEQHQISFPKTSERQFLIDAISDVFPDSDKEVIEVNVNYCCSQMIPPTPLKEFLDCVIQMCEEYRNKAK
jgi:hypothetical protein